MKNSSEKKYPRCSLIITLISISVLACAVNALATKNPSEEEVTRLVRVISSVTDSRFPDIPLVEVRNSSSVKEILRSDEKYFQAIVQKKDFGNFELRITEDVDLLGRYSYISRAIYLSEDLLQKYADMAKLDVEVLKRLVLIHELIHAQEDELYGVKTLIGKASTAENWFALSAVIEGHAQQTAFKVYERVGISEQDIERYTELILKPRYLNPYWPLYAKGMDFWTYIQRESRLSVKDVFAKLPKYGEQVLQPRKYLALGYAPPANLENKFVTLEGNLPWFFKTVQRIKIDPLTFLVNSYIENGKNDLIDHFKGGLMFCFYGKLEKRPEGQQGDANPIFDATEGVLALDIYETASAEEAREVYEYCKNRMDFLNGKGTEADFASVKKKYPTTYCNFKLANGFGESGGCLTVIKSRYVVEITESNLNISEKDLLLVLEQIEKRL